MPPAIAHLPKDEVEKICAGEVVERPLNVVKELVENSLDAGATRITIELGDGGKELIRVSDNGSGIPADELPLALKPHCTSKIRALDDIYMLSTLGFRGEGLSSVATISRLRITSHRAGDDLGARIEVHGGAMVESTRMSFQPGTEVEVRDLFYNTPVRRKFLRSKQAETGRITTLLSAYALAYPEVRWQLSSNGRALLSTSGDGEMRTVLTSLTGPDVGAHLTRINFEFPPSAVTGYISDPQYHRHNRQRQWYFINRRPVANKMLYKAVDDAVREFLSAGKFPIGAFFLTLPPEEIDVNVHPMKHEVSFAQPQSVYSLLQTAVSRALGAAATERQRKLTRGLAAVVQPVVSDSAGADSADVNTEQKRTAADDPATDPDAPFGQRAIPLYQEGASVTPPVEHTPIASSSEHGGLEIAFLGRAAEDQSVDPDADTDSHVSIASSTEAVLSQSEDYASNDVVAAISEVADRESGISLVGQVAASYLVAVTDDAVYLIDQHAAHERILFEELYARLEGGVVVTARQQLLFPLVVQLSPGEAEIASECSDDITALGFCCELGAGDNLVVREVPMMLAGSITPELLHAVLTELSTYQDSLTLAARRKELAASLACQAAIKAGDPLSHSERIALVKQLLSRASSLSCPHGRPTIIQLSKAELAQMFLR